MERIKLTEHDVNLETLAVNLSGGQRQRLSFVRALSNDATVLFCDEPTGNLDEANANELFEIIRENINNGITAVVVSHDINLALRHADQIIIISKDPAKGYGEIKDNNIFHRDQWNANEDTREDARKKIRALYSRDTEKNAPEQEKGDVNLKNSYRKLFFTKEGKALLGKKSINLYILTFIIFFTFLAIGFGNGSLHYLQIKMSSAFVNWLTIRIPWKKADVKELKTLQKKLADGDTKGKYFFENTSLYKEEAVFVWRPESTSPNETNGEFRDITGRSIDVENDAKLLNESILDNKNIATENGVVLGLKTGLKHNYDVGVIVTQKLLDQLNYKSDAKYIDLQYSVIDSTQPGGFRDLKVPIPIKAIVYELPGTYGIIYPQGFMSSFFLEKNDNFNIEKNKKDIHLFYSGASSKKGDLERKLHQIITQNPTIQAFNPDINPVQDTQSYMGGYDFDINFSPVLPTYQLSDSIKNIILTDPLIKEYARDLQRVYYYQSTSDNIDNIDFDVMSVYFTKLDRVRDFAKNFSEIANTKNDKVRFDVDDTKVKEKENIDFLSNILKIISYLLILFSAFAVCLFIINLLKTHLSKVKMNIGTFKAIGLSNKEARNIYFYIILFFVSVALTVGFLLAYGCGYLLNGFLTSNMHMEDVSYFKIFDRNTYLTIVVILFSSISCCWLIINNMLSKTPGDLIYNR